MKSLSLLSSFVGYDASAWSVMFPGIGKKGTRFSRHWKHDVRVGVQIAARTVGLSCALAGLDTFSYVAHTMRRALMPVIILSAFLFAWTPHASSSDSEGDIPVAPISPETFQNWTNAYRLTNPATEVIVAPSIGRIVSIRLVGTGNFLHLDAGAKDNIAHADSSIGSRDVGGSWLQPVSEPNRSEPAVPDLPWTATAWRSANGSRHCLITKDYGDPLHITVRRAIKLDPHEQKITIRQRIQRTATSHVPVTLRNITRVASPEHVFMPVDASSVFDGGYKVMVLHGPTDADLRSCRNTLAYNARSGGAHKLGSDAQRAWVAAQQDEFVIVASAEGRTSGGAFPDGGCRVEMAAPTRLGYADIETLSEERMLAPGETLENVHTIRCYAVETNMPLCELSKQIQRLLGEHIPPDE